MRGVPVIASDIAVFREVGGDGPRYFDLLDSKSLAAAIEDGSAGDQDNLLAGIGAGTGPADPRGGVSVARGVPRDRLLGVMER